MAEDDNPEWDDTNTAVLDYADKLKVTRARMTMSQAEYSTLLRIPLSSLRNWEQRRTVPDGPARTLIDLVYRYPEEMREKLQREAA